MQEARLLLPASVDTVAECPDHEGDAALLLVGVSSSFCSDLKMIPSRRRGVRKKKRRRRRRRDEEGKGEEETE